MRYYVIINGVNSLTKTGLAIKELPPISKPLMRTQIEEIDGRDGDIITELGYSAYDKELEIGLYGEGYDINDIIAFFNNSGTIVFSNEPDKYYNFKIIEQIDYEKLLKFKTAIIKIHVQPFKYPLNETPIEITEKTVTVEGENLSINNTMEAPIKIDLKGNSYQESTIGTNLIGLTTNQYPVDIRNGEKYVVRNDASNNLTLNLYTNYGDETRVDYWTIESQTTRKLTASSDIGAIRWTATPNGLAWINKGETLLPYEKYTGGQPSPSPDFPQDIEVVKGNNTIKIVGKNIFDKNNATYSTKLAFNNDYTRFQTSSYSTRIYYIECAPNTTYSISKSIGTILRCGNCNEIPANNVIISSSYSAGSSNQVTFTTNSDKYIYIYLLSTSEISTISYESVVETLQVEKNSTVTNYEAYQGQSYPINLPVENLFDKNNANIINGFFTLDNSTLRENIDARTIYIPCNANTTYTISKSVGARFYVSYAKQIPEIGITLYNRIGANNDNTPLTITTDSDAKYLVAFIYNSTVDTTYTLQQILDTIQIEEGTKANSYTPYGVEPIELCKLGDYQDYIAKSTGKNLFDKDVASYTGTQWATLDNYIEVKQNKTYTLQGLIVPTNWSERILFYDENKNELDTIDISNTNNNVYTFTTPLNTKYIRFNMRVNTINFDTIQLEEGNTATLWEPSKGKWYKHKEIYKVLYDGSETWTNGKSGTENYYYKKTIPVRLVFANPYPISNQYPFANVTSSNTKQGFNMSYATATTSQLLIRWGEEQTLEDFRANLSVNNLIFYGVLYTKVNEEITDTALINQLNALESAIGYDNQTNIIQSNADLPFILNVTAFLDTNLKATINNIGNIYSKPILDIKATGIVGIYLEGNQIFSVDLSNDDECIIDTNRLEAYDPATQNLMNRKVTGDYNLFKLNIGNNNVSATGDVDKITITNYTRWL